MRTKTPEEYTYNALVKLYDRGVREFQPIAAGMRALFERLPSYDDGYVYFISKDEMSEDHRPEANADYKRIKIL